MEVKSLQSIPLWFTRILSDMKIYPNSFSKYGEIYKSQHEKTNLDYVKKLNKNNKYVKDELKNLNYMEGKLYV